MFKKEDYENMTELMIFPLAKNYGFSKLAKINDLIFKTF